MKATVLGLTALLAVMLAQAPAMAADVRETRGLDFKGIEQLEVKGFNGSITVRVGKVHRVNVILRNGATFSISSRDRVLTLEGSKPVICMHCVVDFEVTVPSNLRLQLETANGQIDVQGAVNWLSARTAHGSITTQDTGRADMKLLANNGGIEVLRASGALEVRTWNGPIRLTNLDDSSLNVQTATGAVTLERVGLRSGSRSTVKTLNGLIKVTAMKPLGGCVIRGRTTNGPISFLAPGFETSLDKHRFEARHAGDRPSELDLQTVNSAIMVLP